MIEIEEINGTLDDTLYEILYSLMKNAFKEREDQGLIFKCTQFSFSEFKKDLDGKMLIIAKRKEGNEVKIVGFQKFIIEKDYIDTGLIAVSPGNKRLGIGSLIFLRLKKTAYENNCKYMIADTAINATSSVNWHIKNGYFRYKLRSYPSTNYYSVVFRLQIEKHWFWSCEILRGIYFYISTLLCHLYRKKDGSLTILGKIFNPIKALL